MDKIDLIKLLESFTNNDEFRTQYNQILNSLANKKNPRIYNFALLYYCLFEMSAETLMRMEQQNAIEINDKDNLLQTFYIETNILSVRMLNLYSEALIFKEKVKKEYEESLKENKE